MKKLASRIFGGFVACTLLLFSIPFTAFAAHEIDGIIYNVGSGGYVVSEVVDHSITSIKIPEYIQVDGFDIKVVGVEDYAFGYCNNLRTIYAPISFTNASIGNTAFLNAKSIVEFINKEVDGNVTANNVIKYIAKKLYNNENYTEAELNEIQAKFESKLNKVDTTGFDTPEDKVMTFIKNIDKMELSQRTLDKLNIWLSTVTYSDMTIRGENGTDIQTYTEARNFLGLKYEIAYSHKLGEKGCELYYKKISTMNNGIEDGISIIGYTGNIQEVIIPDKIDYLPVVDIAENAFSDAANINAIRVPKTVVTIADEAIGFNNGTQIPGFKVYGHIGTEAHTYAINYNMTFVDVTNLPNLSNSEFQLNPGDMVGIILNNYSGDVRWVSSDTTVATVFSAATKDEPGLAYISAVGKGQAIIYAFAGTAILECHVSVSGSSSQGTTVSTTTDIISGLITTTTGNGGIGHGGLGTTTPGGGNINTGINTGSNVNTGINTGSNVNTGVNTGSNVNTGINTGSNVNTGINTGSNVNTGINTGSNVNTGINTGSNVNTGINTGSNVNTGVNTGSNVNTGSGSGSGTNTGTGVITTSTTTSFTGITKYVFIGDANDDGKVNIRDAAYIAIMLAKGTPEILPEWSDYNRDGKVNIRDAAAIAIYMAQIGPKHFVKWIIVIKNK